MSANRYIRFVELSSGLIRDSRTPLFASKFSKRNYTQHQLLILLLLKEYLSEGYRDTVELTEVMDTIREKIHRDEVPHFTETGNLTFISWIEDTTLKIFTG